MKTEAESEGKRCTLCGQLVTAESGFLENGDGHCVCSDCAKGIRTSINAMERRTAMFRTLLERQIGPQSPAEIKNLLDESVVGQEHAKRILSVSAFNHLVGRLYTQLAENADEESGGTRTDDGRVCVDRSNVLLLGPTGCGKTQLVKALGEIIDVPVQIVDTTALTPVGYIGDSATDVLAGLIRAAGGNIAEAEFGIVFLDEIDKLACRNPEQSTSGREINGVAVQRSLLKFLEGSSIDVPQPGIPGMPVSIDTIDTSHVLFIGGGAFDGLLDITARRINGGDVGFGTGPSGAGRTVTYADVTTDDLIEYGFMPEFIGRLPVLAPLEALDRDALVNILTVPRNSLCAQYREIFDRSGVKLDFTPEALNEIADRAMKMGTGARGLRSILNGILETYMYEWLGNGRGESITITGGCVRGTETAPVTCVPESDEDLPFLPTMRERLERRLRDVG